MPEFVQVDRIWVTGEDKEIVKSQEHMTSYYGPAQFTYDAVLDLYRCPQGQSLRPFRREQKAEKVEYRADPALCNACPVKAQCTSSDHGRQLHRSFYADYLERVKGYHQTFAYQKAMNKRKVWVEPLFGEAKEWHGMRRFRLRRLWRVNCEALVTASGQNLKRLLQKRGWGRRPFPTEVVVAAPPHREPEESLRYTVLKRYRPGIAVASLVACEALSTFFEPQTRLFSSISNDSVNFIRIIIFHLKYQYIVVYSCFTRISLFWRSFEE